MDRYFAIENDMKNQEYENGFDEKEMAGMRLNDKFSDYTIVI